MILEIDGFIFDAVLEEEKTPRTFHAFMHVMPFGSQVVHVGWSGEALWIPSGDRDFGVAYEEATSYPLPGQILLHPKGKSETEILIAYGSVHFASKAGTLAGNHFATITANLDKLSEIGVATLWEGSKSIHFYEHKSQEMKNHDVYSFGVIASSSLYLLDGSYPSRSGYAEILNKYRNIGGEVANTSIVLVHLGVAVKRDGNWINPDEDAKFLQEAFNQHDIDISHISLRSCIGPKEMLVVDTTSAGDSFRAGVIYGYLKKWTTQEIIQFASALAAMVCQSFPGVLNSPGHDEVLSFM